MNKLKIIRDILNIQIIRFLLIGSVNTIFYYSIYCLFIYIGLDYRLCVFFATLIGIFFSFMTFGKYVFNNSDKKLIYKFIFVYMVLYFLNIFLISRFQVYLDNYYLSGFLSAFFCTCISFFINKLYVFKKENKI
jgi:putative flippase GtrA